MRTFPGNALLLLLPLLVIALCSCAPRTHAVAAKQYDKPLAPGQQALEEVDPATLPQIVTTPNGRTQLRAGIANSLAYFTHANSTRHYPVDGITRDEVIASLHALDELLAGGADDAALNQALHSRFTIYRSIGCDAQATVLFTGYYTPIWHASLTETAVYRYPIYKRPADLVMPPQGGDPSAGAASRRGADGTLRPYPERAELRASDQLRGTELAWLPDPFAAYCVEIQGNAKLLLDGGKQLEVGYDGTNNYAYHSIGLDLVKEGKIRKQDLNYFTIRAYFLAHPDEAPAYLDRNPRVIFFRAVTGQPSGSLGQPVLGDVTIATDKTIFPPGAACLVQTTIADPAGVKAGYVALRLDQDTGGGIKAPGHADLYMGEGETNERRAGSQYYEGHLYYLILRK